MKGVSSSVGELRNQQGVKSSGTGDRRKGQGSGIKLLEP